MPPIPPRAGNFAWAWAAAFLLAAPAHSVTITVPGDEPTIAAALQASVSGDEIVVSLSRLNRVREIDTLSNTVTAEAGVVLEALHRVVDAADRMFPLSLASQGSCEIGGNLYAVVSVNSFENVAPALLRRASANFATENEETRLARRARSWIPRVVFTERDA